MVPKRDFDSDGGNTSSDDCNTDVPPRLSAKPPPKPPRHGVRKNRAGADCVGPGKKTTPRERDSVRGVYSGSEGENNDGVKAGIRKGSKGTRSSGKDRPKQQQEQQHPKPTLAVPPAKAAPAPSACDMGAVPLLQNAPPPKPPAVKAARPGGGATKTVTSNTGASRGGTRKSITPKISATPGKKSDAKPRRVKPKGAGVVARKGASAPEDDVVGVVFVAAPKVAHGVCPAGPGDDATIGAPGEKPAHGSGGKSVATKRSKASSVPASRIGKGGATAKKKADKRGGASGGRMSPGHGPARRPASSPASRSVGSPRRHAAAVASTRSPSAPPNSVAASRRARATVDAAEERKTGEREEAAGASTGKSTSGQRKEKKSRKREELPVPPLRSKLLPDRKNVAS